MATTTTGQYAAPFLQPLGGVLADYTAGLLTQPKDISGMLPQVAGVDPFTQAAQQRAATQGGLGNVQYDPQGRISGLSGGTGIAAYEPYLQKAESLTGPNAYQAYMSPYQQDIINSTLANYDVQAQKGIAPLNAQATSYGNLGSARQGVQQAEYKAQSDLNRGILNASLLGQGFNTANTLRQQDFSNLLGLGTQQQGFEQNIQNQLGGIGAQSQQYGQGILNAVQQGAAIQNQYPLQNLQGITNLFSTLSQATPASPGQPVLTNPYLSGAQAFASIYGPYSQSQAMKDALLIKQGIDPKTGGPVSKPSTTPGLPSLPPNWWDLPVDPSIYNPVEYPEGDTGGESVYTDYGQTAGDSIYTDYPSFSNYYF